MRFFFLSHVVRFGLRMRLVLAWYLSLSFLAFSELVIRFSEGFIRGVDIDINFDIHEMMGCLLLNIG